MAQTKLELTKKLIASGIKVKNGKIKKSVFAKAVVVAEEKFEKCPVALHAINQNLVNSLWKELQETKISKKKGKHGSDRLPVPFHAIDNPLVKSLWDEIQKAAASVVTAEDLYKYEVVTHGVIKFSSVGEEHVSPDGELDEGELQEAIDDDWSSDYLGKTELGLGEYAEDLFGGGYKTFIPAPKANITHVDKFELIWNIKVNKKLSHKEEKELLSYVQGQCSDGWGEGFEQHSVGGELKCEVDCNCEEFIGKCPKCEGDGHIIYNEEEVECPKCEGDGMSRGRCPECDDRGVKESSCEAYASPWEHKLSSTDTIKFIGGATAAIKLDRTALIPVPTFTYEDIASQINGALEDTDDNLIKVVKELEHSFNPDYGINWETISDAIEIVKKSSTATATQAPKTKKGEKILVKNIIGKVVPAIVLSPPKFEKDIGAYEVQIKFDNGDEALAHWANNEWELSE